MDGKISIENVKLPTAKQLEDEIKREKYNKKYRKALMSTLYTLIVVAAVAVLIATIAMPVMEISGNSMSPTLNDKEIVVLFKTTKFERGELICFSYQNKLLIKRVIGTPGDVINIDKDGNVFVNSSLVNEPYLSNKALGECDIKFPYTVSENHYFVMGDNRTTSIDSRSGVIGEIGSEQAIGKIFMRIKPLSKLGFIS